MYLDLRSAFAIDTLFEAIGLFIRSADVAMVAMDTMVPKLLRMLDSKSVLHKQIDQMLEKAAYAFVSELGVEPFRHTHDFIIKTIHFDDGNLEHNEEKIPKCNLVAALRLLRRCLNRIAALQSPLELLEPLCIEWMTNAYARDMDSLKHVNESIQRT